MLFKILSSLKAGSGPMRCLRESKEKVIGVRSFLHLPVGARNCGWGRGCVILIADESSGQLFPWPADRDASICCLLSVFRAGDAMCLAEQPGLSSSLFLNLFLLSTHKRSPPPNTHKYSCTHKSKWP